MERALATVPLVLRESGSGTRGAVAALLAHAALDRADIVQVGSTEAARRCVLAGLGYSFISRRAVASVARHCGAKTYQARNARAVGSDHAD